MSKYIAIWNGLRGMYMPDTSNIVRVDTRRELKEALEIEAYYMRDAGYVGLSKRAIATLAAETWREAQKPRPSIYNFVAPCSLRRGGDAAYALGCNVSNRADWLAQQENDQ